MRMAHQSNSLVDFAIVEDDERRLAAELERAELRVAARAAARTRRKREPLRLTTRTCTVYIRELHERSTRTSP